MDNPHGIEPEPSEKKALYSGLGWAGVFGIFILILLVAYFPNQSVDTYAIDREARMEIKQRVEAEQATLVDGYSWVNQAEGTVRIPVERAMRLTVEELRGKLQPE